MLLQQLIAKSGMVLKVGAMVFFLGAFGVAKFTPAEMAAIEPLVTNSPFLMWLPGIIGYQLTCYLIGAVEMSAALLILFRPISPRLAAAGEAMAAVIFSITLSFLVTTPGIEESAAGFIIKDLALLGIALWWTENSWAAHRRRIRAVHSATVTAHVELA